MEPLQDVAPGSWPAVSPDGGKIAFVSANGQIDVVPADSPNDLLTAEENGGPIVFVDPSAGINADLKTYVDGASALIDRIVIADSGDKLSPSIVTQLSTLISGPLGVATVTDPQAPAGP